MSKRLIAESFHNSLTEQLQIERHGIADSMGTEDVREGVWRSSRAAKPASPAADFPAAFGFEGSAGDTLATKW
jgi:hypothetical protein